MTNWLNILNPGNKSIQRNKRKHQHRKVSVKYIRFFSLARLFRFHFNRTNVELEKDVKVFFVVPTIRLNKSVIHRRSDRSGFDFGRINLLNVAVCTYIGTLILRQPKNWCDSPKTWTAFFFFRSFNALRILAYFLLFTSFVFIIVISLSLFYSTVELIVVRRIAWFNVNKDPIYFTFTFSVFVFLFSCTLSFPSYQSFVAFVVSCERSQHLAMLLYYLLYTLFLFNFSFHPFYSIFISLADLIFFPFILLFQWDVPFFPGNFVSTAFQPFYIFCRFSYRSFYALVIWCVWLHHRRDSVGSKKVIIFSTYRAAGLCLRAIIYTRSPYSR